MCFNGRQFIVGIGCGLFPLEEKGQSLADYVGLGHGAAFSFGEALGQPLDDLLFVVAHSDRGEVAGSFRSTAKLKGVHVGAIARATSQTAWLLMMQNTSHFVMYFAYRMLRPSA